MLWFVETQPENLIFESKADNTIKITDFGLAKYRTENFDLMTSCCGTPGYVGKLTTFLCAEYWFYSFPLNQSLNCPFIRL